MMYWIWLTGGVILCALEALALVDIVAQQAGERAVADDPPAGQDDRDTLGGGEEQQQCEAADQEHGREKDRIQEHRHETRSR